MIQVTILGIGLMGQPMVTNLAQKNIPVMAYNRSPEKLEHLQSQGITTTSEPQKAIEFGQCLILMLTDYQAIKEVILDSHCNLAGKTIIQMGTIAPDESKLLLKQVEALGGNYLEAPVLGSIPEVRTGNLLVMVGATETQFQQWQGLLSNFSPKPLFVGEVGQGAALKLALNQMIAGLTSTFALSLSFLEQEGVNIKTFMDVLRDSALYAPTFDKKLTRMVNRNFTNPNFPSKHLLKDINLFLTSANDLGLNTNILASIKTIVAQTVADQYAEADYSALIESIRNNPDHTS